MPSVLTTTPINGIPPGTPVFTGQVATVYTDLVILTITSTPNPPSAINFPIFGSQANLTVTLGPVTGSPALWTADVIANGYADSPFVSNNVTLFITVPDDIVPNKAFSDYSASATDIFTLTPSYNPVTPGTSLQTALIDMVYTNVDLITITADPSAGNIDTVTYTNPPPGLTPRYTGLGTSIVTIGFNGIPSTLGTFVSSIEIASATHSQTSSYYNIPVEQGVTFTPDFIDAIYAGKHTNQVINLVSFQGAITSITASGDPIKDYLSVNYSISGTTATITIFGMLFQNTAFDPKSTIFTVYTVQQPGGIPKAFDIIYVADYAITPQANPVFPYTILPPAEVGIEYNQTISIVSLQGSQTLSLS